ncbi:MAG: endonuclease/exonuclease/phosphatase family protein [Myxococcota bacterium]
MIAIPMVLACTSPPDEPAPPVREPVVVRFATFNVSMFRDGPGELIADLADPANPQARALAALLQRVRPDVLLLNEVDQDADGEAVRLLHDRFLGVAQGDDEPLDYPFRVVPPTNTGVASGVDLDGDGVVATEPGSAGYGGDTFGFGLYPGQYGLAVLSRFPVGTWRSFRELRWADVPGNDLPRAFYSAEAQAVLRLSSKTHLDVPVDVEGRVVHLLASHPTPPGFDGPEDRNGRRNRDEIEFWTHYVDGGGDWLVDDEGRAGGLEDGASFVIAGDLNADPVDGASRAIRALLDHPRVQDPEPGSEGGVEQSGLQGGVNDGHQGDPALDTSDFSDTVVGNQRLDYVLPSSDLEVASAGVFWPRSDAPEFEWVGTFPFPISEHRLVWVDVTVE